MSSRKTYPSGLTVVEGRRTATTWARPTTTVQEKQAPPTQTGFFASLTGKSNRVAPAPQGGKKKAAPKKAAVKAAPKKAAKAAPLKTK